MSWTRTDIRRVATALADASRAGEWTVDAIQAEFRVLLGPRAEPWWTNRLSEVLVETYRDDPADRPLELARFVELLIRADLDAQFEDDDDEDSEEWSEDEDEDDWSEDPFDAIVESQRPDPEPEPEPLPRLDVPPQPPPLDRWKIVAPRMVPGRWDVPAISTEAELARFLGVNANDLAWLADPRSWERQATSTNLRNYSYDWVPRRSNVPRLIEAPKPWLKQLQRRVLRRILDRIPPHEAAHGFRAGHSAITNARCHVGTEVVLRVDLEDFFARVDSGRVYGVFRVAGYPERVAHLLTALCTNAAPSAVVDHGLRELPPGQRHGLRQHLGTPHLPQGAPTSPALANLVAYRMDARLSGLATSIGGAYTRYADDITISGDAGLLRRSATIRRAVLGIVDAEGFRPNVDKSQLMTRAGRQVVTGIVVNERLNTPRAEYDRLRAVLHDARIRGPEAANREGVSDLRAELTGRIAWVAAVNPERGHKLRVRFNEVQWGSST